MLYNMIMNVTSHKMLLYKQFQFYEFGTHYMDDPLWDGAGCFHVNNNCCTNPGLPWFYREFPTPQDEDIEVRICTDQDYSDEAVLVDRSSVTRLTVIIFTHKRRRSWSRHSSTRTVRSRITMIITTAYHVSPHMLTRMPQCNGYSISKMS